MSPILAQETGWWSLRADDVRLALTYDRRGRKTDGTLGRCRHNRSEATLVEVGKFVLCHARRNCFGLVEASFLPYAEVLLASVFHMIFGFGGATQGVQVSTPTVRGVGIVDLCLGTGRFPIWEDTF